jgi:hypothetical protein
VPQVRSNVCIQIAKQVQAQISGRVADAGSNAPKRLLLLVNFDFLLQLVQVTLEEGFKNVRQHLKFSALLLPSNQLTNFYYYLCPLYS